MTRASVMRVRQAARQGKTLDYFADEDRSQRNTLALRDVDYAVEAELRLTPQAGPNDTPRKFEEMFQRRLERGQFFVQPCLGCREFPALVEPYTGSPPPIQTESRDLGYMLHDMKYRASGNEPVFFRARVDRGVVEVPEWDAAG